MLAVLVAALAHDVPEQHAALRGIDHVFHRGGKDAEWRGKHVVWRRGFWLDDIVSVPYLTCVAPVRPGVLARRF